MERRYDYTRTTLAKIVEVDDVFGDATSSSAAATRLIPQRVFHWKPALIAMEPPCDAYADRDLNAELRKKTSFVLDGFAARK